MNVAERGAKMCGSKFRAAFVGMVLVCLVNGTVGAGTGDVVELRPFEWIALESSQSGVDPEPALMNIETFYNKTFTWSAQSEAAWLKVTPANGTSPGGQTIVAVGADVSQLTPGYYKSMLLFGRKYEGGGSAGEDYTMVYLCYSGGAARQLHVPSQYATIQAAVEDANDLDTVVVADGVYTGDGNRDIDFMGKAITVRSANGPANCIIDCNGSPEELHRAFILQSAETWRSQIQGFTIRGAYTESGLNGAIMANRAWPTIKNCIFVDNTGATGAGAIDVQLGCDIWHYTVTVMNCTFYGNISGSTNRGSAVHIAGAFGNKGVVRNSIMWNNSEPEIEFSPYAKCGFPDKDVAYNILQSDWWFAENTLVVDPCFVDAEGGDLHLMSQGGRWDADEGRWVKDERTSPCVDAGDPMWSIGAEPFPNGGRVNMGAYGGTAQASKSWFGGPPCETIVAGDINGDCRVDFVDLGILSLHWLDAGQ